jgi:hypothetical protein
MDIPSEMRVLEKGAPPEKAAASTNAPQGQNDGLSHARALDRPGGLSYLAAKQTQATGVNPFGETNRVSTLAV